MKKVLIIAYLFPPIGGGGVQRALKMAKYLGDHGCDVSVLTVENPRHVLLDSSLLAEVPKSVAIYRAKDLGLPSLGSRDTSITSNSNNSSKPVTVSILQKMLQRLKPMLRSIKEALLIPDDQITWYKQAVKLGEQIILSKNIDVVFSTSGPYTNHLVGKTLKQKTGIFWIADFRDPWTQNMHRPKLKWRLKKEAKMERSVIETADILMTVTRSFADNFHKKYREAIKRLEVIHNGFDQEDYAQLKPVKLHPEKWTFIYTGIFYQERNPRLFLESLAELITEGKLDGNQISIQFAGVFDYPGYFENINCVKSLRLEDIVHLWGNLAHKDALALLAGANQLLLIGDVSPDSGAYIPGKLFEYMAVKKPIFALSVAGESAKIIKEQGIGTVMSPSDKEEIKRALLQAYLAWSRGEELIVEAANTVLYQRNEQARLLAKIIKER